MSEKSFIDMSVSNKNLVKMLVHIVLPYLLHTNMHVCKYFFRLVGREKPKSNTNYFELRPSCASKHFACLLIKFPQEGRTGRRARTCKCHA